MLAGAALLRLLFFVATRDDVYLEFRQGDEAYYHQWALRILGGEWAWGRPFFTTPLFAYFLALAYAAGGQDLAYLRLLNMAMGIGTVALTYGTARRILGPYPAVAAALLAGWCTAPIFYEWFPEKTSLVLFLTAAALFLASRALESRRAIPWLVAGVAAGLAALAHSLLIVFVPAVAFQLLLDRTAARRAAARSAGVYALGFLLGVLPATAHNFLQDGSFVLIGTHGGTTFYLGNQRANPDGRYVLPAFAHGNADSEELDFRQEAERRSGRRLSPAEVSRFWFRQGWADIRADPALALRRFRHRLRWAVGDAEETDTRTFAFYRSRHRLLGPPLWGFGLVSLLGLLGLGLTAGRREFRFLAGFTALFLAGTSLVLVYGRYRLPLLVPLALLAAAALQRSYHLARARRLRPLLLLAVAAAGVGWLVYAPVLRDDPVSFFIDFNNQGNRYLDQGRYRRALAEYEKAVSVNPGNNSMVPVLKESLPRIYRGVVDIYLRQGRLAEAEALLLQALARYPGDPELLARRDEARRQQGVPPPSPTAPVER